MLRGKRVFMVLAAVCLASAGLSAAEYSSTVPIDLLGPLTQDGRFYRELPPDFPLQELPEGLSVIGAMDNAVQQQVLLRSLPEGPAARAALLQALEGQGWRDTTAIQGMSRGGFIVPDTGDQELTLCHDSQGILLLRGETGVENRAYLHRRKPLAIEDGSCDERFGGGMRRPAFASPDLARYLPSFEQSRPAPLRGGPVVGVRGLGNVGIVRGGSNGVETRFEESLPNAEATDIAGRHAEQLVAAGWSLDVDWRSPGAAGGVWLLSPEDDLDIALSLTVEEIAEDSFSTLVRLRELE